MKAFPGILFARCAMVLASAGIATTARSQSLAVGANVSNSSFDPVAGFIYYEVRERLQEDFPGTTFTSLPTLTGDLGRFDLIILNRFNSADLQPGEQAALYNYVCHGGNVFYVGEAMNVSNDPFTLPFGIVMTPDLTTNVPITYAPYTNLSHPFLTGPFGAPTSPASGSYAAKVVTLGPSVELARWQGGGIAIVALNRDTLAPGAGFGLFLTDVNMITPSRFSKEVGPVLSNALSLHAVVRPSLGIACAAGCVTLTWDAQAAGWTLQESDDFQSWTNVGTITSAPGSFLDASGRACRFFRLQK